MAAPCFLLFMYMVQLYKEDWGILHMLGCQACSPEQQFPLSSANTAQTIGKFCRYVHLCNMYVVVYLLVTAVVSLHLVAVFIFSHLCPLLCNCLYQRLNRFYLCVY